MRGFKGQQYDGMREGAETSLAALVMILVAAGCGPRVEPSPGQVQSFEVSGHALFEDGTPISSKAIQYQWILDGANLFETGVDGCLPTPAHVAGTALVNGLSNNQGAFASSIEVTSLKAAVVRQCAIHHVHPNQLEGVTIRAAILADAASCPTFCAAQGNPSADCVSSCATGNRTIQASTDLSAAQLLGLTEQEPDGNIRWSQNLRFSRLGPALDANPGADLLVDGAAARATAHVTDEFYAPTSCEVAESCVRAPGLRTLLRFDGTIENLGSSDLVIGSPYNSGLFTPSSCHNVYLLKNIMLYELVDPSTGDVVSVDQQDVIGRKQGFCMMDIEQINASAPQGHYDCSDQGITAGWADVYDSALDCQFLDVTGVPAGNYLLRLTVNPDGLFPESNMNNNTAVVPVSIPPH